MANNTNTLLLVGAGVAALYFFTRPATTPINVSSTLINPATGLPYGQTASSPVSLITSIANLFKGSGSSSVTTAPTPIAVNQPGNSPYTGSSGSSGSGSQTSAQQDVANSYLLPTSSSNSQGNLTASTSSDLGGSLSTGAGTSIAPVNISPVVIPIDDDDDDDDD